jgi:hypothetical protein
MRLQVLTATNMKMADSWDAALCSIVEIDRHFRCAYGPDDASSKDTETSVNFYHTTRRNISEDSDPYVQLCFLFL